MACDPRKCQGPVYCRGVCRACYAVLSRAVRAGVSTWAELERAKLCAPSSRLRSKLFDAAKRRPK